MSTHLGGEKRHQHRTAVRCGGSLEAESSLSELGNRKLGQDIYGGAVGSMKDVNLAPCSTPWVFRLYVRSDATARRY